MSRGTILVVDDEPEVREVLRETLEYEGYAALEAANGREALDHLRRGATPCLILLDLMMPVMNGFEFLAVVAGDPALARVPVLVVSAASRDLLAGAAEAGSAVGVLSKPVQLEALLGAVERYC